MVRRSFGVIKKALPNMFMNLKDERIPNSKQSIRIVFGHLKRSLNTHRGFNLANRKNFLKRYLYYKNKLISRFF